MSLLHKGVLLSYKNEACINCLSFSGGRRLGELDEESQLQKPFRAPPFHGHCNSQSG
jgi:hypothetical protein